MMDGKAVGEKERIDEGVLEKDGTNWEQQWAAEQGRTECGVWD